MSRHWGEETAKRYLLTKGYLILKENYAIRGGEIDLIAQQNEVIVFIEVKQRKQNSHGNAAESISPQKLKRLTNTALHYLISTYGRDDLAMRFDAILISGTKERHRLEHLKNISL
ncbi:MAG: YraN family protein [Trueperaceae bacterium]|nr:YraN family protein [Trueperaceae bacterium]